tara:strand:+ start:275 stop:484 length:210 start_codon:yes stop_codon:yes gene_type:complete
LNGIIAKEDEQNSTHRQNNNLTMVNVSFQTILTNINNQLMIFDERGLWPLSRNRRENLPAMIYSGMAFE